MSDEPLTKGQRDEMWRQSRRADCIPWSPGVVRRYEATCRALESALSVARDHLEIAAEFAEDDRDYEQITEFAKRATRALGDRCPNGCGRGESCSECPEDVSCEAAQGRSGGVGAGGQGEAVVTHDWPYGIGYSEERPCEVCGGYVTYTDDGPPACGEPCAKEAA